MRKPSPPLEKESSNKREGLSNLVNALTIPTQRCLSCFPKSSWETRTACAAPCGESPPQLNRGWWWDIELPEEGPYGFDRPFILILAVTSKRLQESGESCTHLTCFPSISTLDL